MSVKKCMYCKTDNDLSAKFCVKCGRIFMPKSAGNDGVTIINTKCSACGASLQLKSNQSQGVCPYCDSVVLIKNDNEFVFHNIDEAEVKRAETDRMMKLKNLEHLENEKKKIDDKKRKRLKVLLYAIPAEIIVIVACYALSGGRDDSPFSMIMLFAALFLMVSLFALLGLKDADFLWKLKYERALSGYIRIPDIANNYLNRDYKEVEGIFRSAGFRDILCESEHDIIVEGTKFKAGFVDEVLINGDDVFGSAGHFADPNSSVIIKYHDF